MSPRSLGCFLGVACILAGTAISRGEELKLTPSIVLKEEYNDNLFLTESDERETFLTTVSPGIDLLRRSERVDAALSAHLNALFYSDNGDRNYVEQLYRGRVGGRLTPRLRTGAEARYAREARPDRGLEESGLAVLDKTERIGFSTSGEYVLTERTAAALNYDFENTDYQDRSELDSTAHQVGFNLTRDLAPDLKGRGGLHFGRYDFEETRVDSYSATVGLVRQMEEKWSASADLGWRWTRSEFDVPPFLEGIIDETNDDTGWVSSLSLDYRGETGGGSLRFTRNVTVASGRGGATERTGLVLELRRRFTWELSGRVNTGFFLNEADGGELAARDIDEKTILINPVLRYDFSRDLFAEASYQYSRVINDSSDRDADQNRVFVRLTSRFPLLE